MNKKLEIAPKTFTYKANDVFTTITTALLVCLIVCSLPLVTGAIRGGTGSFILLSSCVGVLILICRLLFMFWIYRANKNAHALNPKHKFEFTPGWSVGAFFMPIFCLWWPYRAVKEIWLNSLTTIKQNSVPIILIWWIIHLAYIFASILFQFASPDTDFKHSAFIAYLTFTILDANLITSFIGKINRGQTIKFKQMEG